MDGDDKLWIYFAWPNGTLLVSNAMYIYFRHHTFLHSKFEVLNLQDTQEQSDFVRVVHIAKFLGCSPQFRTLSNSTQDYLCWSPMVLKNSCMKDLKKQSKCVRNTESSGISSMLGLQSEANWQDCFSVFLYTKAPHPLQIYLSVLGYISIVDKLG